MKDHIPTLVVLAILVGWFVYIFGYHRGWKKGFDTADENWRNK